MLPYLIKLLVRAKVFKVALNKLESISCFGHLVDLGIACVRFAIENVILDGCIEQQRLLHDVSNLLPEACNIILVYVDAVDQDFSIFDVVKPQENIDNRAFATS